MLIYFKLISTSEQNDSRKGGRARREVSAYYHVLHFLEIRTQQRSHNKDAMLVQQTIEQVFSGRMSARYIPIQ